MQKSEKKLTLASLGFQGKSRAEQVSGRPMRWIGRLGPEKVGNLTVSDNCSSHARGA